MKFNEQLSINQLKTLVGRSGKSRFAGRTTKCTVEAIVVEGDGVKLLLRDEYNKRIKRPFSKFELDED